MVFYAQSTIMVISERYTFCRYTIYVKNMSMLKNLHIFRWFFLNSRKKWVKHKLKTLSQIYICFVKSIQKTKHFANVKQKSMYKHQTSIFKPLVPSIIPLFRERIRLGHADIVDHSVWFIDTRLKKGCCCCCCLFVFKGMHERNTIFFF